MTLDLLGSDDEAHDVTDLALVDRALDGSQAALRALVERHQPFVYNIALKMFGRHADAEDLTQEVFIKVITSLRTFRRESALRTWLYRITVNHFLKSRRRAMELTVDGFETYFDAIAAVPEEPTGERSINDETIEELRLRCTSGMLMCLERDQRITFILGAIFGVSHRLGADVLDISPGNFRVRLHRARHDLYNWMKARCGLVNAANPCRCSKKTSSYVKRGMVDPLRLEFNADYIVRIETLTRRDASAAMQTIDELHEQVFLSHPLAVSQSTIVDSVLGNETIRSFFALD